MHLITTILPLKIKMKIIKHHLEMTGFPISNKRGHPKLKTLARTKRPRTGSNSRVSTKALITMRRVMSRPLRQSLKVKMT